jgi:hypothetical protein
MVCGVVEILNGISSVSMLELYTLEHALSQGGVIMNYKLRIFSRNKQHRHCLFVQCSSVGSAVEAMLEGADQLQQLLSFSRLVSDGHELELEFIQAVC